MNVNVVDEDALFSLKIRGAKIKDATLLGVVIAASKIGSFKAGLSVNRDEEVFITGGIPVGNVDGRRITVAVDEVALDVYAFVAARIPVYALIKALPTFW